MDTFGILSPDGHPLFVADLPNERGSGNPHHQYVRSEQELQRFIAARDKPGRALYYTVAHLAEGGWRSKENVVASHWVWAEVDFKDHPSVSPEEILRRINAAPRRPNLITFSGHGYHVFWRFSEPIDARPGDAQQQLEEVLKLACAYVGGDPNVAEASRLMRLPGSHNTREEGETLLAKIIHVDDLSCELDDLLDFFLEARPILPRPVKQGKANGHARAEAFESNDGPVDVEAWFAAMAYKDPDHSVNATYKKVVPALLLQGEHPDDVYDRFISEVMGMAKKAGLGWQEKKEHEDTRSRMLSTLNNLLLGDYDPASREIPSWLHGDFHQAWAAKLAEGHRPVFGYNAHGFYVKKKQHAASGSPRPEDEPSRRRRKPQNDDEPSAGGGGRRQKGCGPVCAAPVRPVRSRNPSPAGMALWATLPTPHRRRHGCSRRGRKDNAVHGRGRRHGHSRNLLGEQPTERLRVWFHNGEDNIDELNRRLAAICQHFDIPMEELRGWWFMTSGNEVPLRVAKGYSNLTIDTRLIKCITEAIGDNQIDATILDPLVTLHGVPENDTGKMDTVVRIFAGIADAQDCAVELSHHTRKLLAGSTADYALDDMRGASALKDAMRAVRMLNLMTKTDAEGVGIPEFERTSYFRVDRVKGNNAAPPSAAIWRKFVNVDLPNSDEVGVVVPWEFPGRAPPHHLRKPKPSAKWSMFSSRCCSDSRTRAALSTIAPAPQPLPTCLRRSRRPGSPSSARTRSPRPCAGCSPQGKSGSNLTDEPTAPRSNE